MMWCEKSRCRRPFRPPAYRRQGWRRQEKGPRNRSKEKETGGEHGELRAARSRRVDRQGWREGKSPHALLPRAPRACLFVKGLGRTGRRRRASSRRRPGRPPRSGAGARLGRRPKKTKPPWMAAGTRNPASEKARFGDAAKGDALPPPERTLERSVQGERAGGAALRRGQKTTGRGPRKKQSPRKDAGANSRVG